MNPVDEVWEILKNRLKELKPSERIDLIGLIEDWYCIHCGFEQPEYGNCYCLRDE